MPPRWHCLFTSGPNDRHDVCCGGIQQRTGGARRRLRRRSRRADVEFPTDRRYLATHEWHKLDGDVCTIGITQFAADELTDITYVDLPSPGREVAAGQAVGEIESVKATSELVSGVPGVVAEVNSKLADAPELVNNDTYGEGWIVKIKVTDVSAYESLLTSEAYGAQLVG